MGASMNFTASFRDVLEGSSMTSLLEAARRPVKWLFEGLIEDDRDKGHQWLITGEPKAGKSRLVMQLAIAAVEGTEFLGFKAGRECKVLYFNFELSKPVAGRRALEFFDNDERKMTKYCGRLHIVSEWNAVDLLDTVHSDYLRGLVNEAEPDLIIWDVLRRMTGAEENNNVEMSRVMREIREISSKRTHIVVHHSRKEQWDRNAGARGIRGASAIHAEADGVISIAKIGSRHTLQFSVRSVPNLDEIRIMSNKIGFALESKPVDVPAPIVDIAQAFEDHAVRSRGEMHEFISHNYGIGESAADRMLNKLIRTGVLEKRKQGKEAKFMLREDNLHRRR
jgi:KaiC/GvpD/RAD55 family RecA-like ATPase